MLSLKIVPEGLNLFMTRTSSVSGKGLDAAMLRPERAGFYVAQLSVHHHRQNIETYIVQQMRRRADRSARVPSAVRSTDKEAHHHFLLVLPYDIHMAKAAALDDLTQKDRIIDLN